MIYLKVVDQQKKKRVLKAATPRASDKTIFLQSPYEEQRIVRNSLYRLQSSEMIVPLMFVSKKEDSGEQRECKLDNETFFVVPEQLQKILDCIEEAKEYHRKVHKGMLAQNPDMRRRGVKFQENFKYGIRIHQSGIDIIVYKE